MSKPWHLYITNGATQTEKLEFEDRIHFLVHYNRVEDIRMCICGHQFAKFATNLTLPFEELQYILTRIRGVRVAEQYNKSCYPIWGTHDGIYLDVVYIPTREWLDTHNEVAHNVA